MSHFLRQEPIRVRRCIKQVLLSFYFENRFRGLTFSGTFYIPNKDEIDNNKSSPEFFFKKRKLWADKWFEFKNIQTFTEDQPCIRQARSGLAILEELRRQLERSSSHPMAFEDEDRDVPDSWEDIEIDDLEDSEN